MPLIFLMIGGYLQELSSEEDTFTPSDVERALWSSVVGVKLSSSPHLFPDPKANTGKTGKRKRKR